MTIATTEYVCPNCGGEVKPTLDVLGPDGKTDAELQVTPKGNVGVCQDCNMAVATIKENTAEAQGNPDPGTDSTWNPRSDEGPERPEDVLVWDPSQGGSTSPEVPLEESVPDPEKDVTLTPPDTTTLATEPVGDADVEQ